MHISEIFQNAGVRFCLCAQLYVSLVSFRILCSLFLRSHCFSPLCCIMLRYCRFRLQWFIFVGIFCFIKIYILWYIHDVCTHCIHEVHVRAFIVALKALKPEKFYHQQPLSGCIYAIFSVLMREWGMLWCRDGGGMGSSCGCRVMVVVMMRQGLWCSWIRTYDGNDFVFGTFVLAIFLFMIHLWAIPLGMVKYVSLFHRFKWWTKQERNN